MRTFLARSHHEVGRYGRMSRSQGPYLSLGIDLIAPVESGIDTMRFNEDGVVLSIISILLASLLSNGNIATFATTLTLRCERSTP